MRILKILFPCLALLPTSGLAQQRFVLGTQWDFAGGETNGTITSGQLQNGFAPYYGVYPSFDVKAIGSRTQLDLHYGAEVENFEGQTATTVVSHIVSGSYDIQVSQRLKLNLQGYFSSIPDYTSYSVIQGAVPSATGFQFIYQPSLAQSSMTAVNGGISAVYDLSHRSFFSFSTSATSLQYTSQNLLSGLLYDQVRTDASASYGYKISPHQTIDVKYLVVENQFQDFGKGRTQSVSFDYTRQISPVLKLSVGGGPATSYFQNSPNYRGYVASASLERKIKTSTLSVNYNHIPGDSIGLGTLSNTHYGSISLFSPISKSMHLAWSVNGFTGTTLGGNPETYRGIYTALDLSHDLGRRWLVAVGGAYNLNTFAGPFNQEFKRIYISLRYRAPDLWRPSL